MSVGIRGTFDDRSPAWASARWWIRSTAPGIAWIVAGFSLCGCVDVAQMAAPERGILGQAVSIAEPDPEPEELPPERPFVGVTLEESLGSLDAMDFVVGLDVVKVDKGSPAAEVGIRVGDRVIEANGAELLSLDQWQAVVDDLSTDRPLRLLVERSSGLSEVVLAFETARTEELPAAVRFVERWKIRAEFETVADPAGVHVVIRRIFAGSPLSGSQIALGDTITAVDEVQIDSAEMLVRQVNERGFGDEVVFRYRSASSEIEASGPTTSGPTTSGPTTSGPTTPPSEEAVTLWSPPRYVTRLQVPLLFDYEHDPVRDEQSFSFIDFWLFALYDYRREAESRRHRILYFLEFSSGVGELSDETVSLEDAATEAGSGP